MADSINKQLQQLIITHSVYVEKYKTYESNKMLKILEAADDDLTAQLAKNKGTIASERRLQKQLEAIKALEESYASVFYDEYRGDLKAFAGTEGGWYVERLRELTSPYVNLDFTLPSAAQIYSAAEASFLILDHGVTLDLESMINSVFGTRSQIIEQTLRQGFVLGKTNDQIVSELLGYEEAGAFFDGNMKQARTSMERIVRTSMSHLASTARDEVYSRNDDIVKGYKWCSTLDHRVSPFCMAMDGKSWYYDKDQAPAGVSLMEHEIKPPGHYNCFDKETEVYTDKGWMLFADLKGNEKFWSIDPDTLKPDFVKAINHIKYHYKGEMCHFYNRSYDAMVTPNHQMFVKYRKPDGCDKFRFVDADKLPKWNNIMYRGVNWTGDHKIKKAKLGDYDVDIDLYCKFMGYYLSEGSTTKIKNLNSYRVKIAQETYLDKFYEDLKPLPFKITKTEGAINTYDYSVGADLHRYGKCNHKYVPDIIKKLPPEKITIFLDAFILGDGTSYKSRNWKGGNFLDFRVMSTTSKRLCDDLGELMFKAGGHPSFSLKKTKGMSQTFRNGTYTINHDLWLLSWCRHVNIETEKVRRDRVEYDDMAYCVELEKWHTLMTRRNGKVGWAGNCRSCTVPILKSWKELGINIAEAPEGTRSALDGYVPQSMTYSEWFDKAGEKVQMDVLGPARYKLYKEGGEKITAFMKDGSWLSLEQLKQRGH